MSLTVQWDHPAETILLDHVRWPGSGNVAAAVHRFAEAHAPRLASGEYRFHAAGYRITVRVDRATGTVLVLYLYRVR